MSTYTFNEEEHKARMRKLMAEKSMDHALVYDLLCVGLRANNDAQRQYALWHIAKLLKLDDLFPDVEDHGKLF